MYFDAASPGTASSGPAPLLSAHVAAPQWSVIIPFFNEREYLAATIASLAAQSEPATIILVDNGSTDGSAAVARAAALAHGIAFELITERTPGKVSALRLGLAAVRTRWVATCDADTLYPPHYLGEAQRLLEHPGCVAAGAYFVEPGAERAAFRMESAKVRLAARLAPRLCHAGGAGQCFDVAALRAAGGFDPAIWGYVLEDHEVIHRVAARGSMLYSNSLWCAPSPRERDRPTIRWTALERAVYAIGGAWAGDWFFYSFLAARLERRRLWSVQMRERDHQVPERRAFGPTHSLC